MAVLQLFGLQVSLAEPKYLRGSCKKVPEKSEAELLDQATTQLLKAVKAKAKKDGKRLRKSDLLKQGYPKRFIAKLNRA